MRYTFVVCADEDADEVVDPELQVGFAGFEDRMRERGVLVTTNRLRPAVTATTVKVRNGDLVIADGPFAETKEQIAGFDIIECADMQEAIRVAGAHPTTRHGTIEIRPFPAE